MEYIQNMFMRRVCLCLAQDQSVDSTSKVLGSIVMSVSLSNRVKSLKLRHYDISRAHLLGTVERLIYV